MPWTLAPELAEASLDVGSTCRIDFELPRHLFVAVELGSCSEHHWTQGTLSVVYRDGSAAKQLESLKGQPSPEEYRRRKRNLVIAMTCVYVSLARVLPSRRWWWS
jgi:hypothetical protein